MPPDSYALLLSIKGDIGRLEGKVDGVAEHTSAVSKKADAIRTELGQKLDKHVEDTDAHGLGLAREVKARAETKATKAGDVGLVRVGLLIAGLQLLIAAGSKLIAAAGSR